MSDDGHVEWLERQDREGLLEEYLTHKKLLDDFEAWTYEKYSSEEQDRADYLHDLRKEDGN